MSVKSIFDENSITRNSVLDLFVGPQIGCGSYRRVYELKSDETCVVKLEYFGKDFCNVHEMAVWKEVQHTPIEDWFAPCVSIDGLGLALIQKRTVPFENEADFKEMLRKTRGTADLPDFFDDAHYRNFGRFEGRVVCHDYGFHFFINHGVKAGWRKLALEEGQYELGI